MIEVRYYGQHFTKRVADYLLLRQQMEIRQLEDYIHQEGILIFPILGDNRIPEDVYHFINEARLPQLLHVIILGDHDESVYSSQDTEVKDEVVRVLMNRNVSLNRQPLLVDTPCIDWQLIEQWFSQPGEKIAAPQMKLDESIEQLQPFNELLGDYPRFKALNGQITEINFCTQFQYAQPLLTKLTDWEQLNRLLLQLPYLESIRIPFSEVNEIHLDSRLLKKLKKLDLRGSELNDFRFLNYLESIENINLAAMNLEEIPPQIWSLKSLKKLYAYKNKVRTIPNEINQLVSLEKLSLYRNKISVLPELPSSLKVLNVGGNPIEKIEAHQQLNQLSVRYCGLTQLPFNLDDFPMLKRVDISKNELQATPELTNLIGYL